MVQKLLQRILKKKIAVVGLGYVGLPLAIEFGCKFKTIGFDKDIEKINHYKTGYDPNEEIGSSQFKKSKKLKFTNQEDDLKSIDIFIIAVPTPVDESKVPDFSFVVKATELIAKNMKKGSIIIYESTVYPGATEEICIPLLEKYSKSVWKKDFNVAYSPERINPGDKEHTVKKITKVVSSDTKQTLQVVSSLYRSIIKAGIYEASSIKVAEAAKVIENTQRDLNIALMNECAIIFNEIGIDTTEVLEAANTKWNFLPFKPGLVGGHCVDVDPYYLTYKSQKLGYHPQVILSGRRINDYMPSFIAQQTIKQMIASNVSIKQAKIIILGITFKENCNDIRNSKVPNIAKELQDYGCKVYIHDPLANPEEIKKEYDLKLHEWNDLPKCSSMIIAVNHKRFSDLSIKSIETKLFKKSVIIDVKSTFSKKNFNKNGYRIWRL